MNDMNDIMETAGGRLGRVIAIRLRPGTDVLLGLTEACRRYDINNGVIISGIGSLDGVRYCNVDYLPGSKAGYGYTDTLTLTGPIELTGASGIICHDSEGNVNLHVHITLSDKTGAAFGGHLVEGTRVLLTTDVVIGEIEGIIMGREYNDELGVPLFAPRQGDTID